MATLSLNRLSTWSHYKRHIIIILFLEYEKDKLFFSSLSNIPRDWENDRMIRDAGENPDRCDDIAEQLILGEVGKRINVRDIPPHLYFPSTFYASGW